MYRSKILFIYIISLIALTACTGIPKGLKPIDNFDTEKYLGTWYEIARLDHKFERGMTHVQAIYSKRDKGGLSVVNTGYIETKKQWKSVEGKAYLNGEPNEGRLKVSFFGPFYGGYNILVLDDAYQYALVAGPNRDNLWILARTRILDEDIFQALVQQAKAWGFNTEELIKVDQSDRPKH